MLESRFLLKDSQWERIAQHLPGKVMDRGRTAADNRLFIEAILYIARTGVRGGTFPASAPWNSNYQRFKRWCEKGVWERVFAELSQRGNFSMVAIDSTIVRAHQHAAGPKKKGDQALGRSRGGLTTKIHSLTEAVGRLVHFCLTGGQAHDAPQAPRLLGTISAEFDVADKAYDSKQIVDVVEAMGGTVMI